MILLPNIYLETFTVKMERRGKSFFRVCSEVEVTEYIGKLVLGSAECGCVSAASKPFCLINVSPKAHLHSSCMDMFPKAESQGSKDR